MMVGDKATSEATLLAHCKRIERIINESGDTIATAEALTTAGALAGLGNAVSACGEGQPFAATVRALATVAQQRRVAGGDAEVRAGMAQVRKALAVAGGRDALFSPRLAALVLSSLDASTDPDFQSACIAVIHDVSEQCEPVSGHHSEGLDSASVANVFRTLCTYLVVPKVFSSDLQTLTDSNSWKRIHAFKVDAKHLIEIISGSLKRISETGLESETYVELLTRCAAFLGDADSKWTSEDGKKSATDLLLVLNQNGSKNSVAKYAKEILEINVKPHFQIAVSSKREVIRREERGSFGVKKTKKNRDLDHQQVFENQPWKYEVVECVAVFEWVCSQLKDSEIIPVQHLVIPTVLAMMDDYDPIYKSRGIRMFRDVVLKKLTAQDIRVSGLGNVFFETLRICLSHHSSPEVLREAYPAIIELVDTLELKGSRESVVKLSIIMEEGIIRGLRLAIGGKLEIIRTIVRTVPDLIDQLEACSIKYLEPVVVLISEVLELHEHDFETQLLCCHSLESVVATCWPRIHLYCCVILKACAAAWVHLDRASKAEEKDTRLINSKTTSSRGNLRSALQGLVSLLQKVCGDAMRDDADLLLSLDADVFGPLLAIAE
ncbi:hypothetical protein HDU80_006796 [Chytriomyces hyalinus]|nr:hypothetical protein HDU80_006796 [Chytriomyces hyalinus]